MLEVTKKVAPGKINHKNANKSCEIVLFSSKSATERPSSSTVIGWFAKHSDTKQWTKNANFCHPKHLTFPYRFKKHLCYTQHDFSWNVNVQISAVCYCTTCKCSVCTSIFKVVKQGSTITWLKFKNASIMHLMNLLTYFGDCSKK